MILVGLIGAAGALLVAILLQTSASKVRLTRAVLWSSFVASGFITSPSTLADQDQASTVGLTQVLTVLLPGALLLLAVLFGSPAASRSIGWPEAALVGFLAIAVMSTAWSVNAHDTILKTAPLIVQSATILYLVRQYERYDQLVDGLATFAHVLLGTVLLGRILAPGLAVSGGEYGRLAGIYPHIHPNMVGLVAVVALIAIVTRRGPQWINQSILRQAALFVAWVWVLLEARTRAALLVGVLALAIAFGREVFRRRGVAMTVLFAIGAAILFVELRSRDIVAFLERGQSAAQFATLSGRSELWSRALDLWRTRQIEGFGYYSGHRHALQPLFSGADQSNIDSMWIETLVNLGLIGTAALGVLVMAGSIRAIRASDAYAVKSFTLSALFLLVAATFFNPSLQTTTLAAALLGPLLLGIPDVHHDRANQQTR